MATDIVLVGFSTRPCEDTEDLYLSGYIEEQGLEDEERSTSLYEMSDRLWAGELDHVFVAHVSDLNPNRHALFARDSSDEPIGWLLANLMQLWFEEGLQDDEIPKVCFAGFNISLFTDMARFEAASHDATLPPQFWRSAKSYDVRAEITPKKHADGITLRQALSKLGVEDLDEGMVFEEGDDPKADAIITADVVRKMGEHRYANTALARIASALRADLE